MKIKNLLMKISIISMMVLLVFPSPSQAASPEQLLIDVDMWLTGENTAAGTFVTNGLFIDSGSVFEEFFIAANTSHGVKTLVSDVGTITINYQVKLTWTPVSGIAAGRFVIISGTGAYDGLHGVGETWAVLDLLNGHLVASYSGQAHID